MSLSPTTLEAYARDLANERQQAAAHAALVAQARQAHPASPSRLALSVAATAAHLAVLLSPLTLLRK
jgi:uncharacterized protein YbjT (DUF2867 family)